MSVPDVVATAVALDLLRDLRLRSGKIATSPGNGRGFPLFSLEHE